MHNKNYISVGIDVGSAFSFMTILAPDETVILKPFKITHNNKDSLERAVSEIKKAEELLDYVCYIRYYFPLDREKDDFLLGSWLMSSNTRNLRLSFHQ